MPTPPNDPLAPARWTEQFLKASRKINEADTGTVVAAAGSSFVFGLFTGGLGWIPFGAFASALLYRGYQHYEQRELKHSQQDEQRELQRARQRIEITELERKELEAIAKSKLTEAQKKYLVEKLTATDSYPSTPEKTKQLPP